MRTAVVAGAWMLALSLTSCGGGDGSGDLSGASPTPTDHVGGASPSGGAHHGHHSPTHRQTPPSSGEDDDDGGGGGSTTPPPGAARLGDSLRFGALEVRVLDYRKAGYKGAATGTRVDVVTVEECAASGSAQVQHQTWQLVDADGRTLGAAGGKMVNGHPTEDLPQTLAPGACVTTRLAIGVPLDAAVTAVQDGPDDIWALAD